MLGFSLFIGQAFLYNAITFGFGAILHHVLRRPDRHTGYYFAVIAVGNFFGPLLLGKLFDTVGPPGDDLVDLPAVGAAAVRYGLAVRPRLAERDDDDGCAGARSCSSRPRAPSSAYLTVSEVFPMETRAMSIAFFYAIGTAAGGISGPLLFADLTGTGKVGDTVLAFQIGAGLMCAAGLVAAFLAVAPSDAPWRTSRSRSRQRPRRWARRRGSAEEGRERSRPATA